MAGHSRLNADGRRRNELIAVMARQGFVNYSRQSWQFSLPGAGRSAYDFPITARRNQKSPQRRRP
jgi:zinc D-Ala-D-Ala dipeptidase